MGIRPAGNNPIPLTTTSASGVTFIGNNVGSNTNRSGRPQNQPQVNSINNAISQSINPGRNAGSKAADKLSVKVNDKIEELKVQFANQPADAKTGAFEKVGDKNSQYAVAVDKDGKVYVQMLSKIEKVQSGKGFIPKVVNSQPDEKIKTIFAQVESAKLTEQWNAQPADAKTPVYSVSYLTKGLPDPRLAGSKFMKAAGDGLATAFSIKGKGPQPLLTVVGSDGQVKQSWGHNLSPQMKEAYVEAKTFKLYKDFFAQPPGQEKSLYSTFEIGDPGMFMVLRKNGLLEFHNAQEYGKDASMKNAIDIDKKIESLQDQWLADPTKSYSDKVKLDKRTTLKITINEDGSLKFKYKVKQTFVDKLEQGFKMAFSIGAAIAGLFAGPAAASLKVFLSAGSGFFNLPQAVQSGNGLSIFQAIASILSPLGGAPGIDPGLGRNLNLLGQVNGAIGGVQTLLSPNASIFEKLGSAFSIGAGLSGGDTQYALNLASQGSVFVGSAVKGDWFNAIVGGLNIAGTVLTNERIQNAEKAADAELKSLLTQLDTESPDDMIKSLDRSVISKGLDSLTPGEKQKISLLFNDPAGMNSERFNNILKNFSPKEKAGVIFTLLNKANLPKALEVILKFPNLSEALTSAYSESSARNSGKLFVDLLIGSAVTGFGIQFNTQNVDKLGKMVGTSTNKGFISNFIDAVLAKSEVGVRDMTGGAVNAVLGTSKKEFFGEIVNKFSQSGKLKQAILSNPTEFRQLLFEVNFRNNDANPNNNVGNDFFFKVAEAAGKPSVQGVQTELKNSLVAYLKSNSQEIYSNFNGVNATQTDGLTSVFKIMAEANTKDFNNFIEGSLLTIFKSSLKEGIANSNGGAQLNASAKLEGILQLLGSSLSGRTGDAASTTGNINTNVSYVTGVAGVLGAIFPEIGIPAAAGAAALTAASSAGTASYNSSIAAGIDAKKASVIATIDSIRAGLRTQKEEVSGRNIPNKVDILLRYDTMYNQLTNMRNFFR
jgi:hypothetical protein